MLPAVRKIFTFLGPLDTDEACPPSFQAVFSLVRQLGLDSLSESPEISATAGESLELCLRFLQKALPDTTGN